ncbi:hypothetical protein BJ878DRAFT_560117 [Calycina marina]|uniref:Uncharacterized protein n=1 Tax=Calycina marina TaxID=1763456 RepID=A0A9P7YVV1_9HELO|nr:hypothetical protein BJ878DRAFT_560117 [Calycina marina]
MAEELRRLQVGGTIEQVPTAAEFINPGSELVEELPEELEIVRSIAEARNPARDGGSGNEEELEHPISNYEALQHLHALIGHKEAQARVEADQVLLRLLRTYEKEISARHLGERAGKLIFAHSFTRLTITSFLGNLISWNTSTYGNRAGGKNDPIYPVLTVAHVIKGNKSA